MIRAANGPREVRLKAIIIFFYEVVLLSPFL